MNVHEGTLVATGLKVALVVSRFNSLITEQLLSGAVDAFRRHGGDDAAIDVYRCPGTFELPALLKRVAATGRYDAVIALGAVIRGDTYHFEVVANESARCVGEVQLHTGVPVANAILTTDTDEQAIARMQAKGSEAALVSIEMVNLLRGLT